MGRIRTLALFAATIGTCAAALMCTAGGALAASPPVALDAADNGNPPLIAYSPTDGYTYVAWSAPESQNNGDGGVDLCVLAPNTASCAGGAPVLLTDTNTAALGTSTDNTVGLAGLVILPGSNEVVVLGDPVETGTVAWASPPGGAAFLTGDGGLENGGNFISPVSLFYTTNNAVGISATDVGLFDSYDHFYSYFSDSPIAGPEAPTTLLEQTGNANNGGSFDDQKSDTLGPVIAAEPAPAPAAPGSEIVVGVGANVSSDQPTPTGCVNDAATGYGVVTGTTGASGTLNTQGLDPNPPGFGLLACSADNPVLASGGADGIGVLEQEGNGVDGAGSNYTLDWRPFNSSGLSFGTPVELSDITKTSLDGADDMDASDDSGAGVYASWEDESGLVLDYSANGGSSWDGPVVVPELSNGSSQGDPTIAGIGDGVADLAYEADLGTGEQVFIQPVVAVPLVPATPSATATATASSVTLTVSCAITPCTVTVTITIPAAGTAVERIGQKKAAKLITLATGKLTTSKRGRHTLKLKWNRQGKGLIKRDARLRTTLLLSTKTAYGTLKSTHALKITRRK